MRLRIVFLGISLNRKKKYFFNNCQVGFQETIFKLTELSFFSIGNSIIKDQTKVLLLVKSSVILSVFGWNETIPSAHTEIY